MKDQLSALLTHALQQLQAQQILPEGPLPPVKLDRTRDKSHGDVASNIAMMLAKQAGMPPRELATHIINTLGQVDFIEKTEIAGPGFINFFLSQTLLTEGIRAALASDTLGITPAHPAQTVVVDYSSPNLAKEMHVGHLRSTIIGDAVVRTLAFLGHRVIRQNHVGDWGTQFGMLLALMEDYEQRGEPVSMELSDLESFYRAAKKQFDDSSDFAQRARQLVVDLQRGDAHCLSLWRTFNRISLSHCHDVYARLNVSLTDQDVRGESAYNDQLADIVHQLKAQGLLSEDQGAQCVFLEEFKNRDGNRLPLIVQKADGGYLYATSDLAALRYRVSTLHADRILYFVDQRQALHFQQVFATARAAGFAGDHTELAHMGFGTMNGKDGKPFKTRAGGTTKLIDLLDEAEQRALDLVKQKNPDLPETELAHIARSVGIGAVKYADLSKHRTSDYIFDFDQMLSFEGNTAPYLQYAYTRIASIFRKANIDPATVSGDITLNDEAEQALATKLLQFEETLQQVAEKGLPHLLCTYLFELAGLFSTFYEQCPILKTDDTTVQHSRLQIASLTALTLKQGLALLGIDTLERM